MADCLASYIQNWLVILQVCEKHLGEIDTIIANKVKHIAIKRNAEDFLIRLKSILVALDHVQSDTCVISETVQIWNDMEKTFEENDQPSYQRPKTRKGPSQSTNDRFPFSQSVRSSIWGNDVCVEETDKAMEHINYPDMMASIINYTIKQRQVYSTNTRLCQK